MKKSWIILAVLVYSLVFINGIYANEEHTAKNKELRTKQENQQRKRIRSLYITLDEMEYTLDEETNEARIEVYAKDGKAYMPFSLMEKAFYAPITWDLADYSAIMMWKGNTLKISLLENKIYYQGKEITDIKIDVMPEGIIAVPIADIFTVLDIPYEWQQDTLSVFAYQLDEDLPKDREISEKTVTEKIFVDEFLKYQGQQGGIENNSSLLQLAKSRLGMPYVMGAKGPYAFDCSGFVHWVLTNSGVKNYNRGSSQSLFSLCDVVSAENLKVGDLVFFTRTYSAGVPVTHSAIYIGDGQMIHAAGNRVQITPLSDGYWSNHFYAYGRIR